MLALGQVEDFGKIDAKDDELLKDCFEAHPGYAKIRANSRFLVLGRKGTGKTAICKHLDRERYDIFTRLRDFADYDWQRHESTTLGGRPSEGWKYLMWLNLAIMLLQDGSTPKSEASERLLDFVEATYGSLDVALNETFDNSRTLRLSRLTGGVGVGAWGIKAEGGAEFKPEDQPMGRLPFVIRHVNATLKKLVLLASNSTSTYNLLFDELDRDFRRGNEAYLRRLEGLVEAGLEIFRDVRGSGKKIQCRVFLRTDIFDVLKLPSMKNKIRTDHVVDLDWGRPEFRGTLRSLMEKRFRKALGNKAITWDDMFAVQLVGPLGRTTYEFILDHTLLRPRDVIQFCNGVLGCFKRRTGSSSAESKFSEEDLISARQEYGAYLYREFFDEAEEHFPDLSKYLEMLKAVPVQKFNPEHFDIAYSDWRAALTEGQSAAAILQHLYSLSIIGYRRADSKYSDERYCFRYMEPDAPFNGAASAFKVHEGIAAFLEQSRGRPT